MPTPIDILSSLNLPFELLDNINHAYFLHLLATDPGQVVPPGKSILSMLSRQQSDEDKHRASLDALQKRVESMLHKAFWNEALQSLADPLPSSQITRLKFLYGDIREAITPIFPAGHPILLRISLPISPTSSPLISATNDLREVLVGLRERCAPARDTMLDDTLHRLDDSQTPLPRVVVDAAKSIIEVAGIIKEDLSQFVLGTMNEGQLKDMIAQRARESEQRIVMSLWGAVNLKQSCQDWLSELEQRNGELNNIDPGDYWILGLVQALSSTISISCSLPPSASASLNPTPGPRPPRNHLPPPFLFTASALFYIQNFLQALIITASLRSFVRLPPTGTRTQLPASHDSDMLVSNDFMQRIWTLLKLEFHDHESFDGDNTDVSSEVVESGTKVVNLADEVVRAHRTELSVGVVNRKDGLSLEAEERLRAAVDRTLRTHDPVFILLQKRLMGAIREKLLLRASEARKHVVVANQAQGSGGAPEYLRTGRDVAKGGGSLMSSLGRNRDESSTPSEAGVHRTVKVEADLVVKGFEDPVLVAGMREVWGKITQCVDWVESGWADVITGAKAIG